jgi:hypothetical protein
VTHDLKPLLNLLVLPVLLAVCLASAAGGDNESLSPSHRLKITTRVIDSGGIRGATASFRLLGKSRDKGVAVIATRNMVIGEGFLRTAYFSRPILAPIVTAIEPDKSPKNKVVPVVVSGANFAVGAQLKLSLAGESDILATNVTVVSSGQLTGIFDLTGAKSGLWTVTVTNPDVPDPRPGA